MNIEDTLTELYRKARGDAGYKQQPYARWDKDYAKRISESFGVPIVLRAGRSKVRGGTLAIISRAGQVEYRITIYENQPGNIEHEIAHYIQFAIFGRECLMDKKNYAVEEITAESTAYVLCMMAGNDSREARSVPYVRRYMKAAGIEPESLIPDVKERVEEFLRHQTMPPKYAPIEQKPRFRYGRCGKRIRHVFEHEIGEKSAVCVRCRKKMSGMLVRMCGEPAPIVA